MAVKGKKQGPQLTTVGFLFLSRVKGLRGNVGETRLDYATYQDHRAPLAVLATADLLRKHGGKTKKELEAAGK